MKLLAKKLVLQLMAEKAGSIVAGGCREIAPVLKNFLVEATNEGGSKLRMMSTDLDLAVISETSMIVVQEPGKMLVPARKFIDCMKEAGAGEVEVNLTVTTEKAIINTPTTKWEIAVVKGEKYPDIPQPGNLTFTKLNSAVFVGALRKVRLAVAKEDLRPELTLVRCGPEGVFASDGARVHKADVPIAVPLEIKASAVDELLKICKPSIDPEIGVAQTDIYILFEIGSDLFVITKMQQAFPLEQVVTLASKVAKNTMALQISRADLITAIKRARITADEETNAIALKIADNVLTIETFDKQGNNCEQKVQCHWQNPPSVFITNWVYLQQALDEMDEANVHLKFAPNEGKRKAPVLVCENNFSALINQIMVGNDAGAAATTAK